MGSWGWQVPRPTEPCASARPARHRPRGPHSGVASATRSHFALTAPPRARALALPAIPTISFPAPSTGVACPGPPLAAHEASRARAPPRRRPPARAMPASAPPPSPPPPSCTPLPVGVVDFEYDAPGAGDPATLPDPADHLVGSIFYPAAAPQGPEAGGSGWWGRSAAAGAPAPRWVDSFAATHAYLRFASRGAAGGRLAAARTAAVAAAAHGLVRTVRLPVAGYGVPAAGVAAGGAPFPSALFSHGIGGTRSTYSVLCAELAAQVLGKGSEKGGRRGVRWAPGGGRGEAGARPRPPSTPARPRPPSTCPPPSTHPLTSCILLSSGICGACH